MSLFDRVVREQADFPSKYKSVPAGSSRTGVGTAPMEMPPDDDMTIVQDGKRPFKKPIKVSKYRAD